jgi:hypothetical protein
MIAVRLLSQEEVSQRLREAGLSDTGERFSGDTGNYAIWATPWGVAMFVPQEGPDRRCAEWVLSSRLAEVLKTKPKK